MFNNLGLTLKFYTSVTKTSKLKLRTFWGLIPTFVEVTGKKLSKGVLFGAPSWRELNAYDPKVSVRMYCANTSFTLVKLNTI